MESQIQGTTVSKFSYHELVESGVVITGVAIIHEDGSIASLPKPNRHGDVIHMMVDAGHSKPVKGEQGFILSNGEFVGRKFALRLAREGNQLLPNKGKLNQLYSEDLW